MVYLFLIFLSVSIILSLYTVRLKIRQKRREKERLEIVKDALSGNYNARILRTGSDKSEELDFKINELIEQLQNIDSQLASNKKKIKLQLSNTAHDLRTPLTSIIGYLDAIGNGVVKDEAEEREYFKIVYKKTCEMKRFTDEIFEYSRLEAGDIKIDPTYFDLVEELKSNLIEFIPVLNEKEIQFEPDLPERKIMVFYDRNSFKRIINNLMNNAIQHGAQGRYIGVSLTESGKDFTLTIKDRGIGIPEDKLEHIFDRLFKADDSRKKSSNSFGLGLAITKTLVEKNNSTIDVLSSSEGTAFVLTIKT